jgi:hypothetical protein
LAKSLEFLTNKKFDVEIPKYFLNQLSFFESRLIKLGQRPRSNTWNENGNDGDVDELVIKNTYLNGLVSKNENSSIQNTKYIFSNRKVSWADSNNRNLLCSFNMSKELVCQKEIKPVLSHKKMKPGKSSLRTRSNSGSNELKKSNSTVFGSNNKLLESINMNIPDDRNDISNNNITNSSQQISSSVNHSDNLRFSSNELIKNYRNIDTNVETNNKKNVSKNIGYENPASNKKDIIMPNNYHINVTTGTNNFHGSKQMNLINDKKENNFNPNIENNSNSHNQATVNTRQNNFTMSQNNPQARSYSLGNDPAKNINNQQQNNLTNAQNNSNNRIIYASKYKNVVHNSYNNIIIQSPSGLDNIINNYESNSENINPLRNHKIQGHNKNENSLGNNYIPREIKSSYTNANIDNNNNIAHKGLSQNPYMNAPQNIQIEQQSIKILKNSENQRLSENNYLLKNKSNNGDNIID